LHTALGPPSSGTGLSSSLPRDLLSNLFGAMALVALLAEWFARRLRGLR
jgi:hypothetical protein